MKEYAGDQSRIYVVFEFSYRVAEISYSDWRPVTVAGVKYLKIKVTRRQPLYETSVTAILVGTTNVWRKGQNLS